MNDLFTAFGGWWALGGAYIGGYVATWRPMFRALVADHEGFDWFAVMALMFLTTLLTLFWPFEAVFFLAKAVWPEPTLLARKLGGETKYQKALRLEREKTRLAKLERELGLDDSEPPARGTIR